MIVVTPAAGPRPRLAVLGDLRVLLPVLAGCWLATAFLGWLVLRMLPALPADESGWRVPEWTLGVLCVLLVGGALTVAVERFASADLVLRWVVVALVGWGLANAAGWTVDVKVGGPASGMVSAVVLAAMHQRLICRGRVALALLAGLGGLIAGQLLLGGRLVTVGVVVTIATGLAALIAALVALRVRIPLAPVVALTAASGLAWVGAWAVAGRFTSTLPRIDGIGIEIVLATALCGLATALVWRAKAGVSVRALTVRYGLVGLAVFGFGIGISALLGAVGIGPGGVIDLLDVGTTVGLGLAALVALWPVLRGLASNAPAEHTVPAGVAVTAPPLVQPAPLVSQP